MQTWGFITIMLIGISGLVIVIEAAYFRNKPSQLTAWICLITIINLIIWLTETLWT